MSYSIQKLSKYLLATLDQLDTKEIQNMSGVHLTHEIAKAILAKDRKKYKRLLKESSKRLYRNGWVEDDTIGWVLKVRLEDCFKRRLLTVKDGTTYLVNQRKFIYSDVFRYLTEPDFVYLKGVSAVDKSEKEQSLEAELKGIFIE